MPEDENIELAAGRRDARVRPAFGHPTLRALPPQTTCFFEADPDAKLVPRALAEGVGTLLLTMSVVSSGIVSQRVGPGDALLGLAIGAVAIASTLVSLIVAFGAASGGHFNPLITGLQWLARERRSGCAATYVAAQLAGGLLGAILTGVMFGAPPPAATVQGVSFSLLTSETLASAGLMIVVFGCARSGRTETGPFAVGAWLLGAIIVSPSGSYANPAITLASITPIGPTHLAVGTAVGFVAAEVAGALLALAVICAIYPRPHDSRSPG
ncbi:MAG: aquaporin [Proteobacteria bacterium]|nr:aquaporin [Pseudomonadota bacterium]